MAIIKSVPSPTGGWNARDSLDSMAKDDAVRLDNLWPDVGKVSLRRGYEAHATGLGSNVEMLAEYHDGSTRAFLAAADGEIWDITSAGTASSLSSGYSSNQWQWANFNGSMGLVNGIDPPITYDGASVANMTVSGSGLTVSTLLGVNVYKSRTYFWANNSQDFWYSSVNALGGVLTQFPLSRVSQFGGKLIAMATWTVDSGSGVDDFAVFLMSSGDVIVYSGSDPGSDFALQGVYRSGEPISIRSVVKYGADLIIASTDGYINLRDVLSGKGSKGKIDSACARVASVYRGNFGFQSIFYPEGSMLLFNIPVSPNTTYHQHAMNTITGAACRFKGVPARCWGIYGNSLYFGGDGVVQKFWSGNSDGGANIEADALSAFTMLKMQGQKLATAQQLIMSSEGDLSLKVSVGVDYGEPPSSVATPSFPAGGEAWDIADWDLASWSGGSEIRKDWIGVGGIGYSFATGLKFSTKNQQVEWFSTNWLIKPVRSI